MKLTSTTFFLIALFALPGSVLASNFNYCYQKDKGVDQACLARKNYETDYYIARSNSLHAYPQRRQVAPAVPHLYDENGRFIPTPVPQRQPYVLPGQR